MAVFLPDGRDKLAERFTAMLESALLARALAETGPLPDERRRALLCTFLIGTFNAASAALASSIGAGCSTGNPKTQGFA